MPSDHLLAYDAGCGPCSRFKAFVDLLDVRGRIEFLSLSQAEEVGALDAVEASLRYSSFHLVASGKEALSGADALLPLVTLLVPGGAVVSRVLESLPGCRRAISFGYLVASRLHDRGACSAVAH